MIKLLDITFSLQENASTAVHFVLDFISNTGKDLTVRNKNISENQESVGKEAGKNLIFCSL